MDAKGRPLWRSPTVHPAKLPTGLVLADHVVHTCPTSWEGKYRRTLSEYRDFREYGHLPEPGDARDQSSWTLEAFAVLRDADALVTLALRERV